MMRRGRYIWGSEEEGDGNVFNRGGMLGRSM
jgi:hypothetical protein